MPARINLLGKDKTELAELMDQWGEASFRGKQLFNWIYKRQVDSFAKMSNLAKELRAKLAKRASLRSIELIREQESSDGTKKFLLALADGVEIEAVFMPYRDGRNSLCISTQAGCAMGCSFCATGRAGLTRDLTTAEIIEQLLVIQDLTGKQVSNLVLMGMGEPLANYDAVLKALQLFNDQSGINIGMRKITVSTCGLVPEIKRLAKERLQLTLAVSLHAVDDQRRNQLIPVNKRYPIADLLEACRYYIKETGRRVTFEYALIAGVNDSVEQAEKLARLLTGMLAHVNLIPINKVKHEDYNQPTRKSLQQFSQVLERNNISATIRVERGADIDAACGQLKARGKNE